MKNSTRKPRRSGAEDWTERQIERIKKEGENKENNMKKFMK
jgi:hypothetical protein